MGFRLSRRIGKSTGINLSGHGLSASIRTRIGSFNTDGFTLRTGFKGLTYRGSWLNGRIFGTRKILSIRGLINCVSITVCLAIKLVIVLLVLLGLALVSLVKLIVRLIRGRAAVDDVDSLDANGTPPPAA